MKDLDKRLTELENAIKNNGDSRIWIDGKNATIRVDIDRWRGKPITFPSVYEAGQWVNKQLARHLSGVLTYSVDNICDLYENAQELRAVIKAVIPGVIEAPRTSGRVIGGKVKPMIFDADDHFSASLAMQKLTPGTLANIHLICLSNLIERYFDDWQFVERWKAGALIDNDNRMFTAAYTVFSWNDPRGIENPETFDDFARLFFQVIDLPAQELPIEAPENQPNT